MFQNETIAKDFGTKVAAELVRKGAAPTTARLQGRMAEAKALKSLNKWTEENVGLN